MAEDNHATEPAAVDATASAEDIVPAMVEAIRWVGEPATGHLELLDQRLLPAEEVWTPIRTPEATAAAIRDMVVRGAPAIGLTAAYGVVLGAQELGSEASAPAMEHALNTLAAARPTAVNLHWALERMRGILQGSHENIIAVLFEEATRIRDEDVAANRRIGELGAELLPEGAVLTHCNTGSLATAGYGTALGVIRSACAAGHIHEVLVDETRPYLQGARLTMWELMHEGLPATLVTDSMAAALMRMGRVQSVVVGADRIAANGDTANKIGTYGLAVLAKHHDIPFFVAAPISTVDLATASGEDIEIEERSVEEVVSIRETRIAPEGAHALHPAFDVTPAELITAIITERGVCRANYLQSLAALLR